MQKGPGGSLHMQEHISTPSSWPRSTLWLDSGDYYLSLYAEPLVNFGVVQNGPEEVDVRDEVPSSILILMINIYN